MQAAAHEPTNNTNDAISPVGVRLEAMLIVGLILLSLVLYLAYLGGPALTDRETTQALSAWRSATANVPGEAITSDSPLLYWSQRLSFATLGGNELTARLGTALAGILLGLAPLLFRQLLGRTRAFIFALILTLSPTLLAASRLGSGAVWSLLLAILILWGLWRYWESAGETPSQGYALLAMAGVGGLVFLAEPGGPLLGLILLGAGAIALSLNVLDAPQNDDVPGDDYLAGVRERLANWPWRIGTATLALVVFAISTGFMFKADGISMIGALLAGFAGGFASSDSSPLFFPLTISVFYETFHWVLVIPAIIMLTRRERVNFIERFLMAWLILGIAATLIYSGATAGHALWLSVPLAGLVAGLAANLLEGKSDTVLWLDDLLSNDEREHHTGQTGKWIIALLAFALFMMTALHFQIIVRAFLQVPGGSFGELISRFGQPGFASVTNSAIWLFMSSLFLLIGFFLAASIWGNTTTARGGGIALLAFTLLTGLGSGWNSVTTNTTNAAEHWHINATAGQAEFLRETLLELSFRETGGFPQLPVVVVGSDDDYVAWTLRDFTNARFVDDLILARTAEVIIMPETEETPDLGGSYVGQRFIINRTWNASTMQGFDLLPWWSARGVRFEPELADTVMLWVRQDIFDGQPFQPGN